MTRPEPCELAGLFEDCRCAVEDVLGAVRALDYRRRRFEAHLALLAELDPIAADTLEAHLARELATCDLFPSGRDRTSLDPARPAVAVRK